MKISKYRVRATLDGRCVDNNWTLGDSFGVIYDTREEAEEAAKFLQDGVEHCDPMRVDPRTTYEVTEIK